MWIGVQYKLYRLTRKSDEWIYGKSLRADYKIVRLNYYRRGDAA